MFALRNNKHHPKIILLHVPVLIWNTATAKRGLLLVEIGNKGPML